MSSWKASMEYGLHKIVNDGVTVAKEVVAASANPVLTTRGIEKTTKALVVELKLIYKEVDDSELADVAVVSVGSNHKVGNMIAEAMSKVGRKGVVKLYDREVMENSLIQIVWQRERLYHLQGTNQVLKAHLRSQFSPQPYTFTAAVTGRCNGPAAME